MSIIFTEKEIRFLEHECDRDDIDPEALSSDDLEVLCDKCFDIETQESIAAEEKNEPISERGACAADIVTKITALWS